VVTGGWITQGDRSRWQQRAAAELAAILAAHPGIAVMRVLTRLAAFLHTRGIVGADGISRAVLEDYLAGLHAAMGGRPEHGTHVSVTGLFLTAVRQHGWAPACRRTR
jgi:hypothetical protein